MRQVDGEPKISRQQKVLAAKAAFGQGSSARTLPRQNRSVTAWERNGSRTVWTGTSADMPVSAMGPGSRQSGEGFAPEEQWQPGRGFGLLRFMTSLMLLMVLAAAFHMGFSYEGFDRAYVQERLNDETTWNRLEKQVQQVYLSLEKKLGK